MNNASNLIPVRILVVITNTSYEQRYVLDSFWAATSAACRVGRCRGELLSGSITAANWCALIRLSLRILIPRHIAMMQQVDKEKFMLGEQWNACEASTIRLWRRKIPWSNEIKRMMSRAGGHLDL